MKRAKEENTTSIRVTIDYKFIENEQTDRKNDYATTKTVYEAVVKSRPNIKFTQNHKDMSQLEAIAYTGRKVQWLEKKLPDVSITFQNSKGENIEKIYELMLKLANKTISPK
jgi:hypothetical protein